jgi:hypothetical protein
MSHIPQSVPSLLLSNVPSAQRLLPTLIPATSDRTNSPSRQSTNRHELIADVDSSMSQTGTERTDSAEEQRTPRQTYTSGIELISPDQAGSTAGIVIERTPDRQSGDTLGTLSAASLMDLDRSTSDAMQEDVEMQSDSRQPQTIHGCARGGDSTTSSAPHQKLPGRRTSRHQAAAKVAQGDNMRSVEAQDSPGGCEASTKHSQSTLLDGDAASAVMRSLEEAGRLPEILA